MVSVLQVEYLGNLAPYDYEEQMLRAAGATFTVTRCAGGDDLVARAHEADVIWLEWMPHLTRSVLERLPRCGLVMRWGAGYDQIDVAAATELGIAVANAPTYCTQDVAEHTIGLLLSLSRQIVANHDQMRKGTWPSGSPSIRRLRGATVGVVGLGRIGREVAELAAAFGAHVIGWDVIDGSIQGVERVDLSELWSRSDFVSLHVPMVESTRHLINAATISQLKPGAFLVNASRGGLVDQNALVEALRSGHLAGAALDVFDPEPLAPDDPLRQIPSVTLTPHQAATSELSGAELRQEITQATVSWIKHGWVASIVNPEIIGRQRGLKLP